MHLRWTLIFPISLAACGGDELVAPEGEPAAITIVTGDAQAGRVGTKLELPLVVRVVDSRDRPLAGRELAFAVSGGSGTIAPATILTDADGMASAQWTLGPEIGVQTADARITLSTPPLAVRFFARASEGLAIAAGDRQSAPAGSTLPDPLIVRVTDADNRPIRGLTISWAAEGGGRVEPASSTTGDDGRAAVVRTLGPDLGTQTTIATGPGSLGSVTFTHAATSGQTTNIVVVSGDDQQAAAGSQLPEPLVVRLRDDNGNPVAGATVTWVVGEGGGTTEPPTSTTAADGTASTSWRLGPRAGPNTVRAVVFEPLAVAFSATATAPPASALLAAGGGDQTGAVLTRLPAPLSVRAVDANGDGVAGVRVAWAVASGGGSLSTSASTTRADGTTEVTWTLGPAPGPQTVTASAAGLAGSPVRFTATATVGAPSSLVIVIQPSPRATSGVPFAQQPAVEIRDAGGNPVRDDGVNITAAIASGGGTLGGTVSRATNAEGRAAFTDLLLSGAPGPRTLVFSAPGLGSVRSTEIQLAAGAPSGSRSTLSASPTEFVAGTGSSTITVTVRDAQGTPLSGVAVQIAVSGTGNTLTQPGPTNANGIATGSFSSTVPEPKTVSGIAGGVRIEQTATVTVIPPPPPPAP